MDPIGIDQLKPFVPDSFAGLPKTSSNAEKNGIAGLTVSKAEATYSDGAQKSVTLEIADIVGLVLAQSVAMDYYQRDIDEIEAYGRGPRVKCKTLRGPWQEVQVDVHSWQEVDTPAFWAFLDRAIAGFQKFTERITTKPEDVMPWKVLGQKWHLSKKGFPPGKKTAWKPEVLEELLEMLSEAVPDGQFLWNNQNVVYLMVPGVRKPWATVALLQVVGSTERRKDRDTRWPFRSPPIPRRSTPRAPAMSSGR